MKVMNTLKLAIDNEPYTFCSISTADVLKVWQQVEPHVERALEHAFDDMTPTQVLGMLLTEKLSLVLVTKGDVVIASMTFEICEFAAGKVCHIMTVGGDDLETWVEEFVEIWKAIGRETGCSHLSIKGRKGWERYARKHGFKHSYTYMRLEL